MIDQDELSNAIRFLYDTHNPKIQFIRIVKSSFLLSSFDSKEYYEFDLMTGFWKSNIQPISALEANIIKLAGFMMMNFINKIVHKCDNVWIIFNKYKSFELVVDQDQDLLVKSASKLT